MYQLIWHFFIYAFLGWCMEVAFAAYVQQKFVNRGFLNGPFCPIYGFGVCIVELCLSPIKDRFLLLFVGSVLLTTLLEGMTGWILERIFQQKWWDYSDKKWNWRGYVCAELSLIWGALCIVIIKLLLPLTDFLVSLLPKTVGTALLVLFGTELLADLVATVIVICGLNKQMKLLSELSEKIHSESDKLGRKVSKNTLELMQKYEELLDKTHVLKRRLIQAFPKMKSVRYNEQLKELRSRIAKYETKIREKRGGKR